MSKVRVIRYTGSGHKGMTDDEVHIQTDSSEETLCGYVDTFMPIEEVNETVNCKMCSALYQEIKSNKKRIKFA